MDEALYLGFDFGLKFIGVAVGDTTTGVATPLTHLLAQKGVPHWPDIDGLIQTWHPQGLIVGWPLNVDGSTQALNKNTQGFVKALKRRYALPIHLMDERYTTVAAKAALYAHGGLKKLTKENIDSYSAKLICESYLKTQALK